MRVLDLFSGIGGFSFGLERAGMRTVAFCEIDPFCRAVLAERWPGVAIFGDIRGIDGTELGRLGGVDVICGGFPCQDISAAGLGAGLAGSRSGLWSEYWRLIRLARPRFVIVENVSALLFRGLGDVLRDLATIGYDAEWHCIPASSIGAPHRRDRVWIVAYPNGDSEHVPSKPVSDAHGNQLWNKSGRSSGSDRQDKTEPADHGFAKSVADTISSGSQGQRNVEGAHSEPAAGQSQHRRQDVSNPASVGLLQCWGLKFAKNSQTQRHLHLWESESGIRRVAHGVPHRVHRLKALGNAVVPQIVEEIGRAIMSQCSAQQREVKP